MFTYTSIVEHTMHFIKMVSANTSNMPMVAKVDKMSHLVKLSLDFFSKLALLKELIEDLSKMHIPCSMGPLKVSSNSMNHVLVA